MVTYRNKSGEDSLEIIGTIQYLPITEEEAEPQSHVKCDSLEWNTRLPDYSSRPDISIVADSP